MRVPDCSRLFKYADVDYPSHRLRVVPIFHARSRFARSTILGEKSGLLVVYPSQGNLCRPLGKGEWAATIFSLVLGQREKRSIGYCPFRITWSERASLAWENSRRRSLLAEVSHDEAGNRRRFLNSILEARSSVTKSGGATIGTWFPRDGGRLRNELRQRGNSILTNVTTQIWVILLTGPTVWKICSKQSEAHPDLGSDRSSVWNFFACSSYGYVTEMHGPRRPKGRRTGAKENVKCSQSLRKFLAAY